MSSASNHRASMWHTGMILLCLLAAPGFAGAETVRVTVKDREGQPVPDVAVFLESQVLAEERAPDGTTAVMDQVDRRFVPHILVVQTGTRVEFPNSDTVAHHVYSFSHPNEFKLPIYKGDAHAPVLFEENGVVILGCNIHDHMLAYIVVVDTPSFAKTNEDGVAILENPGDEYAEVSIWSPRIRDDAAALSVAVDSGQSDATVAFRLQKTLRPPHNDQSDVLSWSEY